MRASKVPPKELRRVVIAASVGNIIEWYDFYIFGSLASILAVKFFEKGHPVAAFLSTVAIFSVGFLIRPLGAFVFGWLGDKVGRKYTFIVTLTGMGLATALIGFVPTYQSIGLAAAFILFGLRLIQGLCLGGEYGGAITYVAEHIEDEHRGYYTGWLQTSPTLGIVVSLATIIGRGAAPPPTRGARRFSATTSSTSRSPAWSCWDRAASGTAGSSGRSTSCRR